MTSGADRQGRGRETGPFPFLLRALLWLGAGLLVLAGLIAWLQARPGVLALDGHTMGSTWSLRVVAPRSNGQRLATEVQAFLDARELELSGYRPDGGLAQLNAAPPGAWVPVASSLRDVLAAGQRLAAETGGAFNMGIAPVVALWGFGSASPRADVPAQAEIDEALAKARAAAFELDVPGGRARRVADAHIDIDALAPGYVADRLSDWLLARGLASHLVDIGGELRARGRRADGERWRVGIERPVMARGEVEAVIAVEDVAVATSGDYRDFFMVGDTRYSHILDPRSGRPAAHALASVTVIAPTAQDADGFATAIAVLGPEEGMALAGERGLAVYMLLRDGDGIVERYNDRFAPYLGGNTAREAP